MKEDSERRMGVRALSRVAIWGLGAAALTYLAVEHRPHLFGWLPYLVILACPLMHYFMHRNHHHGGRDSHAHLSRDSR